MANQIKCSNCNKWTPAESEHCYYCKHEHYAEAKKEKEELAKVPISGIPFIEINESDAWYIKAGKYVIRGGQLIFFVIISVITYIASSVAH